MRTAEKKDATTYGETYLTLSDRCNQECLFCSAVGKAKKQTAAQLRANIARERKSLNIGGWEPTLSKDLPFWVGEASKAGIPEIIVRTNALAFQSRELVRKVVKAGATQFSVNLPSHIPEVCDFITQTKGLTSKRIKAIKTITDVAGGEKVRLTVVVNSLNATSLADYARFVAKELPEVRYIGLNLVLVEGRVKARKWLVPRLSGLAPELFEMVKVCRKNGIALMIDDIPLCFLEGIENVSIDVWTIPQGDTSDLEYKRKYAQCKICGVSSLCGGLTNDYHGVYGAGELRASKKTASALLREIKRKGDPFSTKYGYRKPRRKKRRGNHC